ncbi:MAG: DUF1674 domain-containing protein [Pararhodobacter sp.]|nr:DUF1674 domain-containing protein [Pararhodobacter sp.]
MTDMPENDHHAKVEPAQDSDSLSAALTPAAQRALAEAEARRRAAAGQEKPGPRELGGRDGPEPVRYGDWERNGLAIDF